MSKEPIKKTSEEIPVSSIIYQCAKQGVGVAFPVQLGMSLASIPLVAIGVLPGAPLTILGAFGVASVSCVLHTFSCTLGKVSEQHLGESGLVGGRAIGNAAKYGAVAIAKGNPFSLKVELVKGALNGAFYGASSAWLASTTHSKHIHDAVNMTGVNMDISAAVPIEILDAMASGGSATSLILGTTAGVLVAGSVKFHVEVGSEYLDRVAEQATTNAQEFYKSWSTINTPYDSNDESSIMGSSSLDDDSNEEF